MLFRVAACITLLALVAAGRSEPSVKDRGRELVEDVCTYCHNLDRLQGKQYTREEWRGVIKGMIDQGAPVTDKEFSMILDYLVKNHGPDDQVKR